MSIVGLNRQAFSSLFDQGKEREAVRPLGPLQFSYSALRSVWSRLGKELPLRFGFVLLRRGFSVISFFYLKKREEQVKKGEWCVFLKFEGFPEYFGLKGRKLPFYAIKTIFHLQFDHRLIFLLINPFEPIFFVPR